MFTPKSFYDEWDRIISDWYQDKDTLKQLIHGNKSLSIDHLPEPYYGNMDECSIVIINLNPGTGLCDQCWLRKNVPELFVNDVLESKKYSNYAKAFPLIPGPNGEPAKGPEPSINWWKSRNAWIKRILSHTDAKTSTNMPFAIELVPLHSKSFKVANTVEYVKSMPDALSIFDAIGYAIEQSDAKMGLAIGRPIHGVLTDKSFGDKAYHDVPMLVDHKTPLDVKRHYQVIENSSRTHRILCTWSEGSNKAPSEQFKDKERELIMTYFCQP